MKYHNSFLVVPMFLFSASAMSAVTPKITKINVTPTSATAGTMFKFSAELNNPLPEGYKLKIAPIGLTGFTAMTGTNNSYSLSRAIYKAGKQTYKVVVVNAKNVTQGTAKTDSYTVTSVTPSNHAPTLAFIKAETTAITNTAYTVTLNAKDIDANLNSITMNWGDNSEPETLTAKDGKDLIFSHIYTSASSFGWNAFASDKGTPVLNSKSISKIVTVSNPEPVEVKGDIETFVSGSKTFSYTKIANDGSELPKTTKLGTGAKDWACTKDNNTGLIWEVKTDDGGLHDKDWTYSWYEPDASKNGDVAGKQDFGSCAGSECDTYGYTNAVNEQGLCGAKNWQLPTNENLRSLVYCSNGKYNNLDKEEFGSICPNTFGTQSPTVNIIYFPNTQSWYWSASTPFLSFVRDLAWSVVFNYGNNGWGYKYESRYVRLVHNP